jgi:hypothetical protein
MVLAVVQAYFDGVVNSPSLLHPSRSSSSRASVRPYCRRSLADLGSSFLPHVHPRLCSLYRIVHIPPRNFAHTTLSTHSKMVAQRSSECRFSISSACTPRYEEKKEHREGTRSSDICGRSYAQMGRLASCNMLTIRPPIRSQPRTPHHHHPSSRQAVAQEGCQDVSWRLLNGLDI